MVKFFIIMLQMYIQDDAIEAGKEKGCSNTSQSIEWRTLRMEQEVWF